MKYDGGEMILEKIILSFLYRFSGIDAWVCLVDKEYIHV